MARLNLGAGSRPDPEAVNHDISHHSDWVDITHDLEVLPWPWDDGQWQEVTALDVMEHLRLEVVEWLDECHRILTDDGTLTLRVPAYNNPLSYRDPTHQRVFHPETFDYWDPDKALWRDFGRYYFPTAKWWTVNFEGREHSDFRFTLRKR